MAMINEFRSIPIDAAWPIVRYNPKICMKELKQLMSNDTLDSQALG
jgi:hypothetical protein